MSYGVEKVMPAPDVKECSICSRLFSLDRINTHEAICQKSSTIRRKSFDISEQRNKGTDAERIAKTTVQNGCQLRQDNGPCGLSTNWRQKQEELLHQIKDAKKRATECNKKINDLPYPPVQHDTDCIQCQHCSRQFNQNAALRHIANCGRKVSESIRKAND